jgi:hypothetical protein
VGVAQSVGPEFKPQYHKKKKKLVLVHIAQSKIIWIQGNPYQNPKIPFTEIEKILIFM